MSSTPRFCRLLNTDSQKLAPSLSDRYRPRTSFFAFQVQRQHGINRFALIAAILADFIVNGVQPDEGANLLLRVLLLFTILNIAQNMLLFFLLLPKIEYRMVMMLPEGVFRGKTG
ncbi:Uncharacterised protein [Salmonella enterica subsp. salamae]|nr:Uncharacterised protein [Salmonella enterica subsp. salamae]